MMTNNVKRFKTIADPLPFVNADTFAAPVLPKPAPVAPAPVVRPAAIHIFEKAGLGNAPYKFTHVEKNKTSCQFCGTPIIYKFWLTSSDGKSFFVGSDCIYKASDAGLS